MSLAVTEGTHGTPESMERFLFLLESEPSPLVASSIGGGSPAFGCHLNPHGVFCCNRRRFRCCKGTTSESMDDRLRFRFRPSPVFESSIGEDPFAHGFHWNPRTSSTRRRYSKFGELGSRSSCSSICPIRVPRCLEHDIQVFERLKERKEGIDSV